MGMESVPKMGTESVPKMGTESVPKMGTPSQNASGLAFWPPAEDPEMPGFSWLGYGFRPHFGYGFRPHFWSTFNLFLESLARILGFLLAFALGLGATWQIKRSRLEFEGRKAYFHGYHLKSKGALA